MASRTTAPAQPPANLAPLVVLVAVVGALVATWFQLPGAVVLAVGVALAGAFYNPPAQTPATAKEPLPAPVQMAMRRWSEMKWRVIVPNDSWMLNSTDALGGFRDKGKALVSRAHPALSPIGDLLGVLAWLVLPTRWVQLVGLAAAAVALTVPANLLALAEHLPAEAVTWDLAILNAVMAYAVVVGADQAVRSSAAPKDPSPGVPIGTVLTQARQGEGGAWRALIGFTLLGVAVAVAAALTVVAFDVTYLFSPFLLLPIAAGVATAAGCLHGVSRNTALEGWRDQVAARAAWEPRWEALKYPEVNMLTHERVGDFVVDTFEAPPSLGSAKAINLYPSLVPYLAAGGELTTAMLTVESTDAQGQPIPGSFHATRFRVVTAPAETQVNAPDPATDTKLISIAAEVGAFHGARAVNAAVPVLLGVYPAHTADSKAAVWELEWTAPLPSIYEVCAQLSVDPETGTFSEGRISFFGDFGNATLSDRTMTARMEQAAYTERWSRRWSDALKMGETQPVLQYPAIKRGKLTEDIELTWEPFLVLQGISPMQYFSKNMRERITTTKVYAPFLSVVGITGALANNVGPGVRHPGGFAVVSSPTPIPANPADIAPAPGRGREVNNWVLGGLINRAFESANLAYPEVISAEALTRRDSVKHVWKVHLRLYDGVTAAVVKQNITKLQVALAGVRWMRVEESEYGCYLVMGAQPHTPNMRFNTPAQLAYCDRLDWAQAFSDAGVRSATDASTPTMLENEPLETNAQVTRMVFSMPAGFNLSKVIEATGKLRASTANGYVDIRAHEIPDRFVVLAAEQDPIPFPAFPDWDLMADVEGKKYTRLPFAQTTDGSVVSYDWALDPHIQILGASGGGKSILLQMLMAGAILRNCDVFLIDPIKGGQDFDFAVPFTRAMVQQGDYVGAGELLQFIGAEAEERKKLNVAHKVGNYKDLPDDIRPQHMFVIIDEFQSLLKSQAKLPKEPDSDDEHDVAAWESQRQINLGVGKVAKHIGKLAREARSVGITLVLAGQAMKATDLAAVGLGGLKSNFSRIAVGKMTYGDMASAFKDPSSLPDLGPVVPPGRGIFESTAAAALVVQNWWQPPGEGEPDGQKAMGRELSVRVAAIPDERRVDVDSLAQRVLDATPKTLGSILEDVIDEDEGDDEPTIELSADDFDLNFDFDFTDDASAPEAAAEEAASFELLSPPESAPEEPATEVEEELTPAATERPLFHVDGFVEMTYGLSGEIVIGTDVVFGVNAPMGDGFETGWPEGDALEMLLGANPGLSAVVWVSGELDELDDIGVSRREIAEDIAARFGVSLISELAPAPAPAPATVPAPSPGAIDFGDIAPRSRVQAADDMIF